MSEHWLHYGSDGDSLHCAECGIELPRLTVSSNMLITGTTAKLATIPKLAGEWIVGNYHIAMTKRPRWLTRQMMRWVFEWEWKDE